MYTALIVNVANAIVAINAVYMKSSQETMIMKWKIKM